MEKKRIRKNQFKQGDAPKLLLKTKEKPSTTNVPNTSAISIATRETPITSMVAALKSASISNTASDNSTSSTSISPPSLLTTATKVDPSTLGKEPSLPTINVEHIKAPAMSDAVNLVTDHYQIETTALQFLHEANSHFHVIGVIGPQSVGKSTLLNVLFPGKDTDRNEPPEKLFHNNRGFFRTKPTAENLYSTLPTTEGIDMYITADRTILLDCSPILCNPYKKDYLLNEIDDLKLVIFMLSVCQTVLVIDEESVNLNLLRLLSCAEMMKPDMDAEKAPVTVDCPPSNQSTETMQHFPRIMFVQNKAEPRHFVPKCVERQQEVYRQCMKLSRLRVFMGNSQPMPQSVEFDKESHQTSSGVAADSVVSEDSRTESQPLAQRRGEKAVPINTFLFPAIASKDAPVTFNSHSDTVEVVKQFQQRVLMAGRLPFPGANPFTEKHWWQLVLFTWESHKTNYFLRKYETEHVLRSIYNQSN